jgi:hypothetical protein
MNKLAIKYIMGKSLKILNKRKINIYHSQKHRYIKHNKYPKKITWQTNKEDRKYRENWII